MNLNLTAGEECQLAAKTLSAFADPRQGAITPPFINSAMGISIFKGDIGVAIVRLPNNGIQKSNRRMVSTLCDYM